MNPYSKHINIALYINYLQSILDEWGDIYEDEI